MNLVGLESMMMATELLQSIWATQKLLANSKSEISHHTFVVSNFYTLFLFLVTVFTGCCCWKKQ